MKKYDIITIGASTRDVFLKSKSIRIVKDDKFSTGEAECFALGSKLEVDDIVFETGGGATNTAVAFTRQGYKTAFIGRIGLHDARGKEIIAKLESQGVDASLVVRDHRRMTAYSVILLTQRGERTVLVYRGASAYIDADEIPWRRIRSNWIYVSSLAGKLPVIKSIWSFATKQDIHIAWNPGASELSHGLDRLQPLLAATDIILLNQEEATTLMGVRRSQVWKAFHGLRALTRGVTVVTLGTGGSIAGTKRDAWFCGTHKVRVVDTTGAGDAFGSGFTGTYVRTKNIPKALLFATNNAESVIRRVGAKHGLLTKNARLRRLPIKKIA